jgi:hypothetical protein
MDDPLLYRYIYKNNEYFHDSDCDNDAVPIRLTDNSGDIAYFRLVADEGQTIFLTEGISEKKRYFIKVKYCLYNSQDDTYLEKIYTNRSGICRKDSFSIYHDNITFPMNILVVELIFSLLIYQQRTLKLQTLLCKHSEKVLELVNKEYLLFVPIFLEHCIDAGTIQFSGANFGRLIDVSNILRRKNPIIDLYTLRTVDDALGKILIF